MDCKQACHVNDLFFNRMENMLLPTFNSTPSSHASLTRECEQGHTVAITAGCDLSGSDPGGKPEQTDKLTLSMREISAIHCGWVV